MDVKNSEADVAKAIKVAPATSYDYKYVYIYIYYYLENKHTGVKLKL